MTKQQGSNDKVIIFNLFDALKVYLWSWKLIFGDVKIIMLDVISLNLFFVYVLHKQIKQAKNIFDFSLNIESKQ